MLMSTALHKLMASLVQAERCAAVGLNSADAAVGSTMKSRPRAANTPLRTLVMTVSLFFRRTRRDLRRAFLARPGGARCDCHHKKVAWGLSRESAGFRGLGR